MQTKRSILLLILCFFVCTSDAAAQLTTNRAGQIDRSYGNGGIQELPPIGSVLFDSELLPDGSLLQLRTIFENSQRISVSKQSPSGELDSGFGDDGVRIISLSQYLRGTNFALQSNGKIVISGWVAPLAGFHMSDLVVIRLMPNGDLDQSFGENGIKTIDLAPKGSNLNSAEYGINVAIYPDGRLLVSATVDRFATGASVSSTSAVILRLAENGDVDTTLGDNGLVATPIGTNRVNNNSFQYGGARFMSDGKIFAAFNVERESTMMPGLYDLHSVLLRFNADGSPDSTFGSAGRVDLNQLLQFQNLLVLNKALEQTDRTILLNGSFGIIKLNPNGSLDTSFGANGLVLPDFPCSSGDFIVDAAGRLVVASSCSRNNGSGNIYFGLIRRFWPDGKPDRRFGNGGRGLLQLPDMTLYPGVLFLYQDRYILMSGSATTQATYRPISARFFLENKP